VPKLARRISLLDIDWTERVVLEALNEIFTVFQRVIREHKVIEEKSDEIFSKMANLKEKHYLKTLFKILNGTDKKKNESDAGSDKGAGDDNDGKDHEEKEGDNGKDEDKEDEAKSYREAKADSDEDDSSRDGDGEKIVKSKDRVMLDLKKAYNTEMG
jgi:hypothetical protein